MIKLLLINILVMAMFALTHGNSGDPETKYLVVNPDKIDYKFTGKNDEHRFGVEVKENKQFHHTRTEEDGVRLGCYGYVHPNGKAYSTHYVADNRGYRIVPHQGEILVYPKDGSVARMASFFESFNEDEIKSSNIRYFFPNGCKSTMIDIKLVDPSATPRPYVSPQFSSKTNGELKTVPGVSTNLNQDTKNFPTKIIPIVTGTVIQNKLNQNKDNKNNKGGNNTNNGSESTGNSKLTSENNPQDSDNKTSGSDKNPANDNNDGNRNNNNDGGNHNNDNNDGNKSNQHTEPIYSRITENSSSSKNSPNSQYLPTDEIEIEEPEKNEFLKIVPVTPSKPIVAVAPLKPIVPVIPSNPSVPVSPLKPVTPVTTIKTSEPIVPVIPSKPIVSVTPSTPSKPVVLVIPTNPIVPDNPSKSIVPVNPFAPSNPILPVSPPTTYPLNPIVSAVDINNQCQDCCEDTQRPTLFMSKNSEATCCKKDVAKLSIPISMDKLAKISMTELIEITSETNTITMLKKLLALAEKYQF